MRNDNGANNPVRPTSIFTRTDGPARPNSLFPPDLHMQPEREPIKFDVNLVGAPPEVEQLVNNIKQVAEEFLYHWKTFPIVLPTPLGLSGDGNRPKRPSLQDLFFAPSFDELDAVATDVRGEPRRLSHKQLECIRERGEFEVASLNFPGQVHRWRLSLLLQKGSERAHEDLLQDAARALTLLLITGRDRISSDNFSVKQSFKALLLGLSRVLDIIIGMPSLFAHNLDNKIKEERCRYLVAELVCRPEYTTSLNMLCNFVRRQLRRATTEKFEVERECSRPPCAVPYLYQTPQGGHIDLRLFKRDTMRKALPILINILEKETRGWFLHFRERLIAELRAQKMPDQDIEREVKEAVMREYLQRVFNSVLSHPGLATLGSSIPDLFVKQAQATVMMHRAVDNVQRKLDRTKASLRERLEHTHPVLSRIEQWIEAKLRAAEEIFIEQNAWNAHQEAVALCTAHGLTQAAYFIQRDLAFMKEREPVLTKELRMVKTPTRSFQWLTQIWFPTNWIIRRSFQGQSEIIPTVLSNQITSIVTPRSDPSQPVFLMEKETVRTTTTRWPMWRWINYCHRTWSWSWNAMFLLGVIIPWCSPVSLRALVFIEPFMSDLELSQVNGTLFPRKSSITPTACSRLISLWRHISKSRTHFETKPDTGFIGKGLTRHINRVWNYLIKGTLGTLLILVLFPIICLLTTTVSLLVASTTFLWMPILTFFLHIFMVTIYDLDNPYPARRNRFFLVIEAVVWNLIIKAIIQPILSIIVAVIICPIAAFILFTAGVLRYWIRLAWDAMIFHCVIKKRGRVPSCDSAFVKRIAGPGLAQDYFFQIRPEQALAAIESRMELDELTAFQQMTELAITQPQRDFAQFVEACFGPFSVQLAKVGPYKQLEKEGNDLITSLHEKLERRKRDLNLGLTTSIRSKIKLNTVDLKIAIQQGALMLSQFYPTNVVPRLNVSEEDFWDSRGLSPKDWAGLAALLYADLFGLDFLTPLGEADTKFRLEPHQQADLSRYADMVHTTEISEGGPDLLGTVYSPRGNISVQPPCLDVSAFNPRSRLLTTSKEKSSDANRTLSWVRGTLPRTSHQRWPYWLRSHIFIPRRPQRTVVHKQRPPHPPVPLPVPHPVTVALIIYNRDADTPIPLDSDICADILRSIEEATSESTNTHESVSRFRGGAGTTGESSIDSLDTSGTISDGEADRGTEGGDGDPEEGTPSQDGNIDGEECQRETLPCADTGFQWTLTNWGQGVGRKRKQSGTVRVDLASPEDVTLDTDSTRVVFTTYGTSV